MYKDGTDFFDNLVKDYGNEKAIDMANNYLSIPLSSLKEKKDREEESIFRQELRGAMDRHIR